MHFKTLTKRRLLDRRRLEDAHFQYANLRVAAWYNLKLSDLPLHGATKDTLLRISSTFYKSFMTKYSGQILSPRNVDMHNYIYNYNNTIVK